MVRDFVLLVTIAVFSSVPIQCAVFGGGGMSPFFVINNGHIYIIMWSCPGNMPKYYPGLKDILPNEYVSQTWVIFWHIAWTRSH